ncbi:MAG: hypothetical protein ACE15D_12160 [Candidatus Eisenbacteria bacterium]
MRREVPLLLAIFFGWFMILQFFSPLPFVQTISARLQEWIIVIAAAAVVLGVANVGRIHLRKLQRKEGGWPYSIPLLAGVVAMAAIGLIGGIDPGTPFDWLYLNAYVPMQGTMFALLAFFIASAAYRAFRIRSWEAGLLAVAAVLVMIGRVPVGAAIWDRFPTVSEWIMNYPQLAAKRAILIGAALGAIATGLKILLGLERGVIGAE